MSRRRDAVREWQEAQRRDLSELPSVARLERPGAFGTFPERVLGSAPQAPTLDDGPLYTGEWREEVNGDFVSVTPSNTNAPLQTVLATLRRPWPFVGFAIDPSRLPGGVPVVAGLNVIMRSARAQLVTNVFGGGFLPPTISITTPVLPPGWVAATGMFVGARVELWIAQGGLAAAPMRGNLWGYNAPGYGP